MAQSLGYLPAGQCLEDHSKYPNREEIGMTDEKKQEFQYVVICVLTNDEVCFADIWTDQEVRRFDIKADAESLAMAIRPFVSSATVVKVNKHTVVLPY